MFVTGLKMASVAALGLTLAACAGQQARQHSVGEKTASECYVAVDTAGCRIAHDLSGGYPISRGGGDR